MFAPRFGTHALWFSTPSFILGNCFPEGGRRSNKELTLVKQWQKPLAHLSFSVFSFWSDCHMLDSENKKKKKTPRLKDTLSISNTHAVLAAYLAMRIHLNCFQTKSFSKACFRMQRWVFLWHSIGNVNFGLVQIKDSPVQHCSSVYSAFSSPFPDQIIKKQNDSRDPFQLPFALWLFQNLLQMILRHNMLLFGNNKASLETL